MNARHKLNSANLTGSFVVAAVLGIAFGSWVVFILAIAILLVTALHDGDIRLSRTGRRRTNNRRRRK